MTPCHSFEYELWLQVHNGCSVAQNISTRHWRESIGEYRSYSNAKENQIKGKKCVPVTDLKWSMAFLVSWRACLASWSASEISPVAAPPPPAEVAADPVGSVTRPVIGVAGLRTWRLEALDAVDFISSMRRLRKKEEKNRSHCASVLRNNAIKCFPLKMLFFCFCFCFLKWEIWNSFE